MNRGNFALEGDEEMKRNCCGTLGRGFDDFSRADLRDIILHKNKVIADLEEHAYGSASWIDNLNKGLKKANEIKGKVDKKPPKESDADFRNRLEGFDKDKDAPTEAWGADELNGDGLFDDIKEGMKQRDKDAQAKWNKMSPQEKLRYEIQENIATLGEERAKWFNKRLYEKLAKLEGGAAPKAEPKPPSGVAVAAEALKPVREAIQNGIGDALYGKSDDPKKQKKGLLGISEEGKEESKKKVMKNIVVPIIKTATAFGKSVKDTANMIFNKDQYDADMKDERIKRIKRDEAAAGIVRDKENPSIIIRKPAGLWTAETTDPTEEAYYTKRIASRKNEDVFYVRVPNPIFAAKLRPSFQELGKAGFVKQVGNERQLDLWTGVQQYDPKVKEDIDGTLQRLHDDEFIWLPENRAKDIYGKLRQFVAAKQDEGVAEGFDDLGWSKGSLKAFAKIDPRTLKGQELVDYRSLKLLLDRKQTENALKKVNKDIADETAKGEPDQTRLTKMREAKVRVEKRLKELDVRGQKEYQEDAAIVGAINAEKSRKREEAFRLEREEAQKQIQQEQAEFEAKPAAERIATFEAYIAELEQENAPEWQIEDYRQQIRDIQNEAASEKVEEQAQGSVDLLQQAEVIGAEGGGMWDDEAEMEGAGAMEWTLQKAGKSLFNPSGDMTMAGRQSFTPDYDAYGETVEEGRKNAFNLSRSMYDQTKAIELPDFKLIRDDTSLRFYRKEDEDVILVGIRGTDVKSWTDLYTWAVIGANQDLRMTTRFQEDLAKMVAFQRNYPSSQFYYVATGSSLAGSIADRFLELGLIEEAITYNPSIERKYVLEEGILNHRVYLDTDPLFMLMGQYAPNTEIRVNPNKTNFYNPSKEKDYLIASHSIYPIYNPAFEGGGMEGSGKTYTIEEWKAIFDAKLEEKRKAIEAREAKKKQTAKAKRERAKGRRDARDEPPPLETPFRTSRTMKATPPKEPEPEEEEPEVEVAEYEMGDEIYLVEEPREGLAFAERRVFDNDGETLGNLTVDDVGKTLVKMVMRREKIGAFADKSPKAKSSSESLPFFESKQPVEEEEEDEDVAVSTYKYKGKEYDIEDPKGEDDMNLEFYANREVWEDNEPIGKLGDDTTLMKALMKLVIKQEFPSQKDYRETMGLDAKKPRASKAKAPASARVELREELVAEQPRSPAGQFAEQAETAVVAVSQAPQQAYMKLMKSPAFTEADRKLLMRIRETKMTPRMRAVLLGRSGLARRVMEILGLDESAFQTQRGQLRIMDKVEKRVEKTRVREAIDPPASFRDEFRAIIDAHREMPSKEKAKIMKKLLPSVEKYRKQHTQYERVGDRGAVRAILDRTYTEMKFQASLSAPLLKDELYRSQMTTWFDDVLHLEVRRNTNPIKLFYNELSPRGYKVYVSKMVRPNGQVFELSKFDREFFAKKYEGRREVDSDWDKMRKEGDLTDGEKSFIGRLKEDAERQVSKYGYAITGREAINRSLLREFIQENYKFFTPREWCDDRVFDEWLGLPLFYTKPYQYWDDPWVGISDANPNGRKPKLYKESEEKIASQIKGAEKRWDFVYWRKMGGAGSLAFYYDEWSSGRKKGESSYDPLMRN